MPFNVSPTQSIASYGTISNDSTHRHTSNQHELLRSPKVLPAPIPSSSADSSGIIHAVSRGINALLRKSSSKTVPTVEHSFTGLASPSYPSINIAGNEVVATLVQSSPAMTQAQLDKVRRMKQPQCVVTTKGGDTLIIHRDENGHLGCPLCAKTYDIPKSLQDHVKKCQKEPPPLEPINVSTYCITPEPYTITVDHEIPFRQYDIVIDRRLRMFVCLTCNTCVSAGSADVHVSEHLRKCTIPRGLFSRLVEKYDLISITSEMRIGKLSQPVYGLDIHPQPLYFCDICEHGFSTKNSFSDHKQRCSEGAKSHQGYGQAIFRGRYSRYVEINISSLGRRQELMDDDLTRLYERTHPGPPDFTKVAFKVHSDTHHLSQFMAQSRWLQQIEGLDAEQIASAARSTTEEDGALCKLQPLIEEYCGGTFEVMDRHQGFGLNQKLAKITEESHVHAFNYIEPATVKKYALVLHRMLFNTIRSIDPSWTEKFKYAELDITQKQELWNLREALESEKTSPECLPLLRHAFTSLFCVHKSQFETSKKSGHLFSPVASFLVASSVKTKHRYENSGQGLAKDGGFRKASEITQTIAALEFGIRATVLYEMDLKVSQAEPHTNYGIPAAYDEFKQYLLDNFETPMCFLYHTHVTLKTIASVEESLPSFTFLNQDKTEVSYHGHRVDLCQVTRMVKDLSVRAQDILRNQMFFGENVSGDLMVDYKFPDIVDDMQNFSPGYSFLDDPRNPFLKLRTAYGSWLLSDAKRAQRFCVIEGGKICWKAKPCLDWLKNSIRLQDILLLSTIVSAGTSSRASEVAREALRNVPAGILRSPMILYNILCLTNVEDKTSQRMKRDKFNPHVPPPSVAKQLVQFFAVIRPFQELLVGYLFGPEEVQLFHLYMWPRLRKMTTSDQLSNMLGTETAKCFGNCDEAMKIIFWRNYTSFIIRAHGDPITSELEKQYYVDSSSNHTTATGLRKYGLDSALVQGVDPRHIRGCIGIHILWHKLIGIDQDSPYTLQQEATPTLLQQEGTAPLLPQHMPETTTLSASSIKRMIDASHSEMRTWFNNSVQEEIRSSMQSAMAEMAAIYWPPPPLKNNQGTIGAGATIIPHPSRLTGLRNFLHDDHAQFTCPEQALLVEFLVSGQQNVLAIVGTGFGKTMAILFAAKMYSHGNTFVVILPLSSLVEDFGRRAKEHQVSASAWTPNWVCNIDATVIYVQIEHLLNPSFWVFLKSLATRSRVSKIIFDECHKVLTDESYREAFKEIKNLSIAKTPIISLTGTMPPSLVKQFCTATNLQWHIIRTASARREISYVVCIEPGDIKLRIKHDLEKRMQKYGPDDRVMIFCRTVPTTNALAECLGVPPYHAQSPNREAVLQAWRTGKSRIMVSTSILGCGMDYPHVREVIHLQISHSMLDYHQEVSRGGRDGNKCLATTYTDGRKQAAHNNLYNFGADDLEAWARSSNRCRRIDPSLFLDGNATTCSLLPGAFLCDYCEEQEKEAPPMAAPAMPDITFHAAGATLPPTTTSISLPPLVKRGHPSLNAKDVQPKTKKPKLMLTMETELDFAKDKAAEHFYATHADPILRFMQYLNEQCAFCFTLDSGTDWKGHSRETCQILHDPTELDAWTTFRSTGLRYPTGICYFCSLPQHARFRHVQETTADVDSCSHPHLIKAMLFILVHYPGSPAAGCPDIPSHINSLPSKSRAEELVSWLQTPFTNPTDAIMCNYLKVILWFANKPSR